MKSPCINCPIHINRCDKTNNADCIKCPARIEYLKILANPDCDRPRSFKFTRHEVNPQAPRPYSDWSSEELSFLKRNYGRLSNMEIAKSLNRSVGSIDRVAYNHHFKRHHPETPDAVKREKNRQYMRAYRERQKTGKQTPGAWE
jgi:hypothetical protein